MVSKKDMEKMLKMRQKLYVHGVLTRTEMQNATTPALSIAAYNQLKGYMEEKFSEEMEWDKADKVWRFNYSEEQKKIMVLPENQTTIDDENLI